MAPPEFPTGITVDQVRDIVRQEVAAVSTGLSAVNNNIAHLTQKVDALDEGVRGDRSGRRPGIVTRIDRLEQAQQREHWWRRVTITGAVGAVGAALASWFRH